MLVIDQGELIGLVSVGDLIKALYNQVKTQREHLAARSLRARLRTKAERSTRQSARATPMSCGSTETKLEGPLV